MRSGFLVIGNGCELDFILSDQPQVDSGDIAIRALAKVAAVEGNSGSQQLDTFHAGKMRRILERDTDLDQ